MKLTKRPSWALGALAAGASIVTTIGLATPAQAALSGNDWSMAKVPPIIAKSLVQDAGVIEPVSCVPGTKFCLAIVPDLKVNNGVGMGQAALVTRNAGRTWTGHTTLPSTFLVDALSCATKQVCWVTGTTWATGGPAVAETTDGGRTWTDKTPADWASAPWWALAIDCPTATTCWMVGPTGPGGAVQAQPSNNESTSVVLVSRDDGVTWAQDEGLTDNGWFNSISCASTQNCWAGGAGTTDALAGTGDGGNSWSVVTSDTSNEGGYVSCLSVSTCVAVTDEGIWVTSDDGGLMPAS